MNQDLFGQLVKPETPTAGAQRRDHLTFRGNVSQGRHGWLRLTPAYSLHIVKKILEQHSQDDFVLDPFSGTGTTPLVSASLDIPCHAVDINPFLVWLGNLKAGSFRENTADSVRAAAKRVVSTLRRERQPHEPWTPNIHAIEKWWDADILRALGRLFEHIQRSAGDDDSNVLALLAVAFCRVMIQTANVSFAHQSMSFRKRGQSQQLSLLSDPSCSESGEQVCAAFLTEASRVAESLYADRPTAEASVFLGDSRKLAQVLPSGNYTTVVTSPPYPNRMSYIRELRPYMYWLGYLTGGRQAGELDWEAIGGTWGCATSLLSTWEPRTEDGIPYPEFDRIIAAIGKDHAILARYVHKYFQDIREHVENLRSVLAPGARSYYVVGNSKFYGTVVPVEQIYAALFEDAGFAKVRVDTIRKRTSKKELYEYVVYAEAP